MFLLAKAIPHFLVQSTKYHFKYSKFLLICKELSEEYHEIITDKILTKREI